MKSWGRRCIVGVVVGVLALAGLASVGVVDAHAATFDPPYQTPSPERSSSYGYTVDLLGNRLVVADEMFGVEASGQGAVDVFSLSPEGADQFARVLSPSPRPYERFGSGVAVASDTLAVGATVGQFGVPGSVFIYHLSPDGEATLTSALSPPSGTPNIHTFGAEVRLLNSTELLVSRYGEVFLYELAGGVWTATASFQDGTQAFGWSLAADPSGNRFAVGSLDSGSETSVRVYGRIPTGWAQEQRLVPPEPAYRDGFGRSISLMGTRLAVSVGNYPSTGGGVGRALLYAQDGAGDWALARDFAAPGGDTQFGRAVALLDDTLVIASAIGGVYSVSPPETGEPAILTSSSVENLAANGSFLIVPTLGQPVTVYPIAGTSTLSSIAVTPASAAVARGDGQPFTATGTYSDGSTADLTTTATWSSSDAAVAAVTSSGLATGVGEGAASIVADVGGVSGAATLTVGPAVLRSIAVTPASASVKKNKRIQFTATGTYSDGSTVDLTTTATWSSSNTAVATITATGLARGHSRGTTTIGASQSLVSGTTVLTVT